MSFCSRAVSSRLPLSHTSAARAVAVRFTWEPYALADGERSRRSRPNSAAQGATAARTGGGGTIDLAVVRLRSQSRTKPAGSTDLSRWRARWRWLQRRRSIARVSRICSDRVRATRDVILLSQRGTGLSRPRPACPARRPVAGRFFCQRRDDDAPRSASGLAAAPRVSAQRGSTRRLTTPRRAQTMWQCCGKALGVDASRCSGSARHASRARQSCVVRRTAIDRVILPAPRGRVILEACRQPSTRSSMSVDAAGGQRPGRVASPARAGSGAAAPGDAGDDRRIRR